MNIAIYDDRRADKRVIADFDGSNNDRLGTNPDVIPDDRTIGGQFAICNARSGGAYGAVREQHHALAASAVEIDTCGVGYDCPGPNLGAWADVGLVKGGVDRNKQFGNEMRPKLMQ